MTIELITGTPGAGKTCYAVSQRIVAEFGRVVPVEREGGGTDLVERRIIVAGVRDLAVAHDRLPHTLTGERVSAADIERWNGCDSDGEPDYARRPGDPPLQVEASLFNWWLWCRPGDLIVCDEVQFIVPRGTLGKSPPQYIKQLEIHRHYGVDFIFITQNPQLLDTTIRNLVGLHRHVRSVMGSPLCMIYTWDHAANPERFNLANKSTYLRRSAHYRLFKSSVAHVAPPRAGRRPVIAAVLLLAGALTFGYQFAHKRFFAQAEAAELAKSSGSSSGSSSVARSVASSLPLVPSPAARVVAGCFTVPADHSCRCMSEQGAYVGIPEEICRKSASSFDGVIRWEPSRAVPPPAPASRPASGPIV